MEFLKLLRLRIEIEILSRFETLGHYCCQYLVFETVQNFSKVKRSLVKLFKISRLLRWQEFLDCQNTIFEIDQIFLKLSKSRVRIKMVSRQIETPTPTFNTLNYNVTNKQRNKTPVGNIFYEGGLTLHELQCALINSVHLLSGRNNMSVSRASIFELLKKILMIIFMKFFIYQLYFPLTFIPQCGIHMCLLHFFSEEIGVS